MKRFVYIILIIIMVISISACKNGNSANWDKDSIANVLPYPETKKIEIVIDDDESFYAKVKKYSEEEYEAYVERCEINGFTIDSKSDNTSFEAYNGEGYKLSMIYYNDKSFTIQLDAPKEFGEFKWPSSEIAKLLPIPKSNIGEIEWEASYGFVIYVGETSQDDYNAYIDECMEKGFTVDYQKGNNFYYADNVDGYSLTLKYEGYNTMFVRIDEPNDTETENLETIDNVSDETALEKTNNITETNTEIDTETNDDSEEMVGEVSPDFKEAMDSYEAFFDEYVVFMKKYANANSNDMASMASDYATYLKQYAETMQALSEIDEEELSTADALYYAEVNARISKKLLEIAE